MDHRVALTARWRRLDQALTEVREAVNSADPDRCPDAVAGALDRLYDLWEFWARPAGLSMRDQNAAARGDADGETAAALVHARGGKSHKLLEFGEFTDTYPPTYQVHYGWWRWQPYSDPTPRLAERDGWYAAHVAGREVLPPLETAARWLGARAALLRQAP